VLLFGYVAGSNAADWIIDNRMPQPIGLILPMDDNVALNDVHYFKPGVHRVTGLAYAFTVSYGIRATNSSSYVSWPDDSPDWARLIVSEAPEEEGLAPIIRVQSELGFGWSFEEGFKFGWLFLVFAFVAIVAKRVFRMAFGGIGE